MKNVLKLAFLLLLFTACEGDPGPPGPQGPAGGLIVSGAFEIEIDFTAANNYEYFEAYGFDVYPYDVTLVYILWETSGGQDVWRLLPQSADLGEAGTLTYNFDFTQQDVRFFLDGSADFDALDASWTQNQVFRVVVVPADNVDGVDISNLNRVMEATNIETFDKKL